jgi:UDP-3-O-[3-hydroxymyristoyl] glucosamine N-acyltransferase
LNTGISLQALAFGLGAEFQGQPETWIDHLAPLEEAGPGALSFLANQRYHKHLALTKASVVIVRPEWQADVPCAAMLSANPYLLYARAAQFLYPEPGVAPGVHPSAVVAAEVQLPDSVTLGPMVVIESGAVLGEAVSIGPGTVIGRHCRIGRESRIGANVTLGEGVILGERVRVQPGAVIGADGFGFANDQGRWVKVPQLGRVVIGNDVEIGANTCIDRGSLRDTCIADGVKIDNLVQVAHNVELGEDTAIAALSGIAGSSRIGRGCTLAGASGVVGHLVLADQTHVTAKTLVTHSLHQAGLYSGNLPATDNLDWRKTIAQLRRLDALAKRVKRLEQAQKNLSSQENTP